MTDSEHQNRPAYTRTADDVLKVYKVTEEQGLSSDQVREQNRRYPSNAIRQEKARSPWKILLDQFRSVVVAILSAAALIALVSGRTSEAIAIIAVRVRMRGAST